MQDCHWLPATSYRLVALAKRLGRREPLAPKQRLSVVVGPICSPSDAMLVFIDTEFTDHAKSDLISLGMAAVGGKDFYAERTDYRYQDCRET